MAFGTVFDIYEAAAADKYPYETAKNGIGSENWQFSGYCKVDLHLFNW
jgi:hypothetical protein